MKKIAFIPTRDVPAAADEAVDENSTAGRLLAFLSEAGWEVNLLVGESCLFSAFSRAVDEFNIKGDDWVILCHDDIEIQTNASRFNEIIEQSINKDNTGFLGVAGAKVFTDNAIWWHEHGKHPFNSSPLSGAVLQGNSRNSMYMNTFGPYGKVAVLDGLFLCVKGVTLLQLNMKKPSYFKGHWDFCDIYYTTQTFLKGLDNYTIPIVVYHESYGNLAGRESWHLNRAAYIERFLPKLPLVVNG